MLDTLDHISWEHLEHAFGEATEVPQWIQALAIAGKEGYAKGLDQLFQHLVHDGERFNSSAAAVPFLYELLTEAAGQDQEGLLYLLLSIAVGWEDDYLEKGLNPIKMRATATPDDWVHLDCYDAVQDGVPALRQLVAADGNGAALAAYCLAFFPERAEGSIAVLLQQLYRTTDAGYTMDLLLGLEFLASQAAEAYDLSDLVAYRLHDTHSVGIAATLATAPRPLDERDALTLVSAFLEEQLIYPEGSWFNEGRLLLYLQWWLMRCQSEEIPMLLQALTQVLPQATGGSLPYLSHVLLHLLQRSNAARQTPFCKGHRPLLTPKERVALLLLLQQNGWSMDINGYAPYQKLLQQYDLPTSRRAWRQFLQE